MPSSSHALLTTLLFASLAASSCRSASPGVGVAALSSDSLDFGAPMPGEIVSLPLHFDNLGTAAYAVAGIDLSDTSAGFKTSFDDAFTVTPGPSAGPRPVIQVSFASDSVGQRSASLTIRLQGASAATATVALNARTVATECEIHVEDGSRVFEGVPVDFGASTLGAPVTRTLSVRNGSERDWEFAFEPAVPGVDFALTEPPFGTDASIALVPARRSIPLTWTFAPSHAGLSWAEVTVRSPIGCKPTILTLVGEGVMDAIVCDEALDFGFTPISWDTTLPLECRNLGRTPRAWMPDDFIQPELSEQFDDAPFRFADPSEVFPAILAPGETRRFDIVFRPSQIGIQRGTLPFTSDALNQTAGAIRLAGIGGAPRLEVAPSLDLGSIAVNTRKTMGLIARNNGDEVPGTDDDRLRFVTLQDGVRVVAPPLVLDAATDEPSPWFTLLSGSTGSPFPDGFDPEAGLAAGESVTLSVAFQPSIAGEHAARLILFTDDRERPIAEVLLRGVARDLEPCHAVYEATIDFGLVEKNQTFSRHLTIRNDRPTDADPDRYTCLLSSFAFLPDSAASFRAEDPANPLFTGSEVELPPGGRLSIPLLFSPTRDGLHTAWLTFYVSSPENPSPVVTLSGLAGVSCLEALPHQLRFGDVEIGCRSMERVISLRNRCAYSISFVGPPRLDTSPFSLVGPQPDTDTVAPQQAFEVSLTYLPTAEGVDEAGLALDWRDGSVVKTTVISLLGRGTATVETTEVFPVASLRAVDMLFVIDTSPSMADKLPSLSANLDSFVQFLAASAIDFHLAVTTADPAAVGFQPLGGAKDERILTPALPPAIVHDRFLANALGSDFQYPYAPTLIYPAYASLRIPLPDGTNPGFARSDAAWVIVIISDGVDTDPYHNPLSLYEQFFRTAKGSGGLAFFAIIPTLPAAPTGCSYDPEDAASSTRVSSMVQKFGGKLHDICQPDWGHALIDFTRKAAAFASSFALMGPAHPDSVIVEIDGIPIDRIGVADPFALVWSFDATRNAVVFEPEAVPTPGQTVSITYERICIAPP